MQRTIARAFSCLRGPGAGFAWHAALRGSFGVCMLLAAGACSSASTGTGDTVQGSCDLTASQGYCQDYVDVPAIAPYEMVCTSGNGTWSATACSHAHAVGGCRASDGSIVNWFAMSAAYPNAASVMSGCAASNGTYVAP